MAKRGSIAVDDMRIVAPLFFEHYAEPANQLGYLQEQLAKVGLRESDLPSYQQSILGCLSQSVGLMATNGLISVFDFRRLNFEALLRRHQPYRPHISTYLEITAKGNLALTWQPYHVDLNLLPIENDDWAYKEFFGQSFDRPENELLFVRNVSWLKALRASHRPHDLSVDVHLLTITAGIIQSCIRFLKNFFEVQEVWKLAVSTVPPRELGLVAEEAHLISNIEVAAGFEIVSPILQEYERLKHLVEHFEKTFPLGLSAYLSELQNAETGGWVNADTVSRRLLKKGVKLTAGKVRALSEDLAKAASAGIVVLPSDSLPRVG